MEFKLEKLSQCKVKMTITLEKEAFNKAIDEALEDAVKVVEVKGFRKGHVPKQVYLNNFGEASLYEKAIDKALNKSYVQAVTDNQVKVVAAPTIDIDFETVGRDKNFTYTAEVEIYPDITLGKYKGVKVKRESTLVSEVEVDKVINDELEKKAELVLVENRPLQNGDTAVLDFEGFVDDVAFDGGKAENYELKIGSGQFIPGFEEQMVGMNTNETKDLNVKFPDEYQAENLKGKDAVFKVKLHEIKKEVLPELNDDFVKELEKDGIETVEAYKADVRSTLEAQKKDASDSKLVSDILDAVCEDAIADIPDALVNEEMDSYIKRLEGQAKSYGLTVDQLLSFQGLTLEKFKENIRPNAMKRVLEDIVLFKVAEIEKITPTEEEIESKYVELAETYHQDVEAIKKQISIENITGYMTNLKTIDFLKDNAEIE